MIPVYWGLYSENSFVIFMGDYFVRNTGIFNEAPMYNLILCLSLSIECFIRQMKSIIRISVLTIAILSTITTTGQFFLLTIIIYFIFKSNRRNSVIFRYALSFIILLFTLQFASRIMEDKQENSSSSYDTRKDDIETCIQVGMENPLLGVGLYHDSGEGNKPYGFSNSIFSLFAHWGIYTLVLYFGSLLFVPLLYLKKGREHKLSLVLISYFLLFSITLSQYKHLTLFMIAYGLTLYGNRYIRPRSKYISHVIKPNEDGKNIISNCPHL